MQIIKREDIPEKRQVRLTIAVDRDTWQASLARCYQGVKSVCPVSGEPTRENIEKQYGAEFLYQEAVNDTYPAALVEAIGQSDIQIAGTPTLTVEEIGADGYTFAAVIDLYPEVQLGQYKGLSAVYPEVELTSDDTEAALEEYARANPHVEHPDRAAMGDEVVLDFEGFVDGVAFEGGKGENYDLKLGSGSFVPGFEEQLVGAKAGEEKDLNITFPEDYHADLAGKAVVFHVKVKEVKESQVPEVDDEFAKDVSEFETLEAFRADLKSKLELRRQTHAQNDFENQVMERLIANMECEIPDGMVDVELDRMMDDYAMQLQNQGISMKDYQKMLGVNGDMIRDSARPDALRRIQTRLALTAVADAENLEVSDEEVEAEINRLAKQYQLEADQVKAAIPAEDLKRDLKMRKASDLVISSAKVGKAPEAAEEAPAEKPKRTRKKKAETVEEPKAE